MTKLMRIGFLAVGLALSSASAFALAQNPPASVAAKSGQARTAAEHARVATEHRLEADHLQQRARALDSLAAQQSHREGPLPAKWPALASRRLREAETQAADSRRAARDSRARAEQHRQLAVEALAQ